MWETTAVPFEPQPLQNFYQIIALKGTFPVSIFGE